MADPFAHPTCRKAKAFLVLDSPTSWPTQDCSVGGRGGDGRNAHPARRYEDIWLDDSTIEAKVGVKVKATTCDTKRLHNVQVLDSPSVWLFGGPKSSAQWSGGQHSGSLLPCVGSRWSE